MHVKFLGDFWEKEKKEEEEWGWVGLGWVGCDSN